MTPLCLKCPFPTRATVVITTHLSPHAYAVCEPCAQRIEARALSVETGLMRFWRRLPLESQADAA